MSTQVNAVLMIGLSVEDLGLTVKDLYELPEWGNSQYLKNDVYLDIDWENSFSGPEDHDTYIGFDMSVTLVLEDAEKYKRQFKQLFGKEAEVLLFATES